MTDANLPEKTSGGSKGGAPSAHPHGPKCSQFYAVFRKFWQNRMSASPPPKGLLSLLQGILDPPLGTENNFYLGRGTPGWTPGSSPPLEPTNEFHYFPVVIHWNIFHSFFILNFICPIYLLFNIKQLRRLVRISKWLWYILPFWCLTWVDNEKNVHYNLQFDHEEQNTSNKNAFQ